MSDFLDLFLTQLGDTSAWEWLAVLFAIIYLLLAVKENIWCWPAAFISTAIYSTLFFDVSLYMESSLNIYYLVMAIYGWYQWSPKGQDEKVKPVIQWTLKRHLIIIITTSLVILLSGKMLELYTDQDFAYLDSFTTWFAVITTYMVTQKVLENWIYWIIIDLVSIYLYLNTGFALTSVLFMSYVIIAFYGWLQWKKHLLEQD
jgi:nicotinamide mononucleotide transporter